MPILNLLLSEKKKKKQHKVNFFFKKLIFHWLGNYSRSYCHSIYISF